MIASSQSAFHFVHHNRSYWMPFLISPSLLPPTLRTYYNWWLLAELMGHLFTAFSAVLFVIVAWKVKVMHINMNILQTYTICVLCQINMLTRLVLIAIEFRGDIEDIAHDLVVLVCLIKTFVWVGIYNYVTYITFERYAALIFSSDYEKNRRIWIPFLLILGNSLFSGFASFLLVYDYLNGVIYVLLTFCVSNLSCAAFMLVKAATVREDIRLTSFNFRERKYTVSQRWQVKDNVRLALEIRFLVVGAAIQVSLYLPFLFVPPLFLGDHPEWRATLELSKAVFQLICAYGFAIAELFVLFTFSRHADYVKSSLGFPVRSTTVSPGIVSSNVQTIDKHFDSLQEVWEMRSKPGGAQSGGFTKNISRSMAYRDSSHGRRHDSMFYLNFINQSHTGSDATLFDCIYTVELFLLLASLIFNPVAIYAYYHATPLHRNIRILLISYSIMAMTGCIARFPLFYVQRFVNVVDSCVQIYLTLWSVIRQASMKFCGLLATIIAAERFVATVSWEWYEKQGRSILIVIVLILCCAFAYCITSSICLIFEIYSLDRHIRVGNWLSITGLLCFFSLYYYNHRTMVRLTADAARYKINRRYQLRENLSVFRFLVRIAIPGTLMAVPILVLFGFYSNGPEDWMRLRYISGALFEMWIALANLLMIYVMSTCDQRFVKVLRRIRICQKALLPEKRKSTAVKSITVHDPIIVSADLYFNMLTEDLSKRRATR